jgi:hypothetical protein
VKLRSALRLYPDTMTTVRVAADRAGDRGGCYHLESTRRGTLHWVKHPEGDTMQPILLSDFVLWLRDGGLHDSVRGDDVEDIGGGET